MKIPEKYSNLYQDFTLISNDYMASKNGVFKLLLANDGNLVLYVKHN